MIGTRLTQAVQFAGMISTNDGLSLLIDYFRYMYEAVHSLGKVGINMSTYYLILFMFRKDREYNIISGEKVNFVSQRSISCAQKRDHFHN